MSNIVIVALIYWIVVVSATYAIRHFNDKKHTCKNLFADKVSLGKRIVTHLSIWLIIPIAMPFILLYLTYKLFDKARYKNRPRPVPKDKRRYMKKDTVLDESNITVSLAEYNRKHKTNFTLDQVYGKGYESAMTEEEKANIGGYSSEVLELKFEEQLIDTTQTIAATVLGNALVSGDFEAFDFMLLDNVETTLYGSKTIIGKNEVIEYWEGWRERFVLTNKVTNFEVKHSHYYSNSCLHMGTMVVLFMVEDTRISRMILAPRHISGGLYTYHDDLIEDYPFSMKYIGRYLKPLRENDELLPPVVKEHRLPCFCCGAKSEKLEWYSANLKFGYHGYFDQVSICPKCNKVVEYFTTGRSRMEIPVIEEYTMLREYAYCWNNLTIGKLENYLSDDFRYSSMAVFEELDKRGYIEYLSEKLQRIAETGSKVKARIKDDLLVVNQDGTNYVIAVKFEESKILRADMVPASLYGLPDKEDLSEEKLNLTGLASLANSCPLRGTKYINRIPSDIIVKRFDFFKGGEVTKTLREVVEECDWMFMSSMVSNKESLEIFKTCYKEAVEDGIFEAANNLGILAFNYEDNISEANRWLNLAAYKGSQNAMINQFSIHWINEEYLLGVVMLEQMLNKQNPSLKCLWNLAILYYKGFSWADGAVDMDVQKTKDILNVIVNYDKDRVCEEETWILEKASKLLARLDKSNGYADVAKEYHDVLLSRIIKTDEGKDKSNVFNYLSSLILEDGKHLGLRIADTTSERGDISRFYIYDNGGHIDEDVLKNLRVRESALSAWQVYLLMTSSMVMPAFWHGVYISRKFIYSENDLEDIRPLQEFDLSAVKSNNLLLPFVTTEKDEPSNRYIAHVYCCYWNEWKGLIREHTKIVINKNVVESFESDDDFVLYEYDCGIYL